jgi:hypothetical protein
MYDLEYNIDINGFNIWSILVVSLISVEKCSTKPVINLLIIIYFLYNNIIKWIYIIILSP